MGVSKRTQVVFRTHVWTPVQAFLFDQITEATDGTAIVIYDASHDHGQAYPSDVSYPIDLGWVKANGLFPVRKWGWRAGDYALYRAAEVCDPFDYMLMLDSDIFVHWPGFAGFLNELSPIPDDLLTLHIEQRPGPRRLAMLAHPVLDAMAEKRSCLFRLMRTSHALLAHALAIRRDYSASFEGSSVPFANDESIFATIAASFPEYTLRTFDDAFGAPVDQTFHGVPPLKLGGLPVDTMVRAVVHPLMSLDQASG